MRNEIVKSNVPKLTACLRFSKSTPVGTCSPLHYHDELEVLTIHSGILLCTVGDSVYRAGAGDVVFINTRVPHSTFMEEVCSYGLVQFRETDFIDGEIIKTIKYSARFKSLDDEPVRIVKSPELFAAANSVIEEARAQEVAFDFFIRSGIFKILGHLYRDGLLTDAEAMYASKEIRKIQPALVYINSHYHEDISLERISEEARLDPSYFCRVFKAATGATFTEYLNFVRVCKAETMLARSSRSILEISEAAGFSSVSYFGRIFKRYRGVSPATYRKARYIAISKGEEEG